MIKQELFKLRYQKSLWAAAGVLIMLMLFVAGFTLTATYSDQQFYFSVAYSGFQWVSILMIILSATCVTMEFAYGTIKQLALQVRSRNQIYFAKWLVMVGVSVCLHGLAILTTMLIQLGLNQHLELKSNYLYHQSLLHNLVANAELDLYGNLLIIGLVFCLASLGRNSGVTIAVSLAVCFFGEGLSAMVLQVAGPLTGILRWNPLNMLNLQNEYGNPAYRHMTHLTLTQLAVGNGMWAIGFITLGAIIFSKRQL